MTNPIPIPDISSETQNPNPDEHCQEKEKEEEEEAPPTPHPDPQSPKTLILPDSPIQNDPVSVNPNQDEDTLMEDLTETQIVDDAEPYAPAATAASVRRGPKRKKLWSKRTAQEKKSREKLQVLLKTLNPIPFIPAKALDFVRHQNLLQRLGLWEFVHIEFDSAIRVDLLAQLISSYTPTLRGSYVNDMKISVNRADLGRALKLPRKTSVSAVAIGEGGDEVQDLRKSIAFLEELVSNWMLLHDDTYIMPNEVFQSLSLIKEGNFEKVDWAGLIWAMVEKELKTPVTPQLVNCYYASHLQHLIKTQHEKLLKAPEEAEAKDAGEEAEAKDEGEEAEAKYEGEEVVVKDDGEEVEVKDEGEEAEAKDAGEEVNAKDEGEEVEAKDEDEGVEAKDEGEGVEAKDEGEGVEAKDEGEGVEAKDEGEGVEAKDEGEGVEAKDEGEGVEAKDEGEEVEAKDEGEEDEEEDEEEEEAVGDEVDGSGDVKMSGVDEGQVHDLEEHGIELSLGQDNVERVDVEKEQDGGEQMMDFEHSKEEEQGMWLLDEKNCVEEPFLRPCHTSDMKGIDIGQMEEIDGEDGQEQEEEEEDAEEDEHEGGFHLSPKSIPLEGMPSGPGSLIQAMEGVQMPFNSGIDLRDNSVGDFLSSRDEPQMISGPSFFGNGHKRDIDLDNHHSLNGSNKRLRSDSPWNSKPADFDLCMEQIEHWMGKARMAYASKDQAVEDSSMNQQLLINEIQKRDNTIDQLHKVRMEENQKRQMEVYRLEKELYMMQSLVDGYRKALKETHKAFAEYRARCPQADEPLYRDVPGSGGLVLSVMELEKERLKKEEEERTKRIEFQRHVEKIEGTWIAMLEGHQQRIESLNDRLLAIEDQVKYLNEEKAERKVSAPRECPSTTEGQTA